MVAAMDGDGGTWRSWLRLAAADVGTHVPALLAIAWPWFAAAAVILLELWLLLGTNPLSLGRYGIEPALPLLLLELVFGLCGAAVAVRMTRLLALGEPLVAGVRDDLPLVSRYAARFLALFLLAVALAGAIVLILGGLAGLGIGPPQEAPALADLKRHLLGLVLLVGFAFLFGRFHLHLAATALRRTDLTFRDGWEMGRAHGTALLAGVAVFYLPAVALDFGLNRVPILRESPLTAVPAYLTGAVVSVLSSAAQAAYYTRCFLAWAPAAQDEGLAHRRRTAQPA